MRLTFSLILTLISSVTFSQQKISGFFPTNVSKQLEIEKQFDGYLNAKNQDTWLKFLSSRPHHVGSVQGKANADYMANLFRQWGYETELATYNVLFPTPKTRQLELLGPNPYKAKLQETALKEDQTSGQLSEQLPTYNAFSADGDVTAELVFVNWGVPADYELLEKMGISVKGKIVIAKYGGSWRGIKPKVAAEHGAIGCLIYSDPREDGYFQGDVYPVGPFRPEQSVQRGSVMDMPVYPGDPTTPFVASTADAKRLKREEVTTIMKIPVLPISYEDALPLLKSLKGPVVPESWRGSLPITYHAGPSESKVHLKLAFNWDYKPIYNVIATMKGSTYPDQWVIRGNHHDGWVNGASDPLSGMVAEMDEARAIAEMAKKGIKPKRTVVFCAWDGEEPSLLGSTEWVEDHADELKKKAVVYLNSDGNSRGFFGFGGSHALEKYVNEVAADVVDPQTGVSVLERRYARMLASAETSSKSKIYGNRYMKIGALGAGSDYSPFFQHLGIPSGNVGYGGEGNGGEYHSIYDSYDHFTRFKDPGLQYGVALAKTAGRLMLRMANADVLPFDYSILSGTINGYFAEIKALIDQSRMEVEVENKLIADKVYELAADPKEKLKLPIVKPAIPYLDFSPVENALSQLQKTTDLLKISITKADKLDESTLNKLNQLLYQAEQKLLDEKGLPRRPWYRHQIYAPGYYTGYGVKTLPGLREGIEEKNWNETKERIEVLAKALNRFDAALQEGLSILSK
ncbi:MAG: transferrin receptor-like dimerization domain-containing protein [Chitinophagaceae bacterium]